jgi:hypothetical protein
MKNLFSNVFVAGIAALAVTACDSSSTSSSFLSNADIGVVTVNGVSNIQMSSVFNLGNVSLAELTIPVTDPKTQQTVGTVSFSQLTGGQAKITLDVATSLLNSGDADLGLLLPNGRSVPGILGATQRGDLFGVNILQNSRVYVGGDLKTGVTAGVALTIPALDSVMGSLSTAANIFFTENYGTSIMGVGGIFGSATAGQSGIAVFAKYTAPAATPAATPSALEQQQQTANDFEVDKLDSKTQRRLNRFFFGKHQEVEVK